MRVGRTLPPTAVHLPWKNLLHGLMATVFSRQYLEKLRREVSDRFGVQHVFLVSSGKAGLYIVLKALQSLRKQRTKVLIPAYTCFSVPSAITKAGLTVTLCDINPRTLDFDYDQLEEHLTPETLCVIPNHLFGIPSEVNKLKDLCSSRDIFVLEDAAQAMGGRSGGAWLGTLGDVGVFSLGRGKHMTCGSGGIVVTNSDAIRAAIVEQYSSCPDPGFLSNLIELAKAGLLRLFIHPLLYWFPSSLPFLKLGETHFHKEFPVQKLHATGAGLLMGWQQRLDHLNKVRVHNGGDFLESLRWKAWCAGDIPYLRLPFLVMNAEERRRLYEQGVKHGMGISMMYPTGIHKIKELQYQFCGTPYPAADFVASRLLAIPTHHLVTEQDKEAICTLLMESEIVETCIASTPDSVIEASS